MHYKFSFNVKIDNTTNVTDPANIDLNAVPPSVYGASTFSTYVKFLDASGTEVGTRTSTVNSSYNANIDWQVVEVDIPALAIPATATKMQAVIYLTSGAACQYDYVDIPSFYVVR